MERLQQIWTRSENSKQMTAKLCGEAFFSCLCALVCEKQLCLEIITLQTRGKNF